ncbi:MAG: type II secretion system F family protein [Armatimonadota bacterium]|nr:type II secretion system F family protein [Armatimonadota bacterium]
MLMIPLLLILALASMLFLAWPDPKPSRQRLALLVGKQASPFLESGAESLSFKVFGSHRTSKVLKGLERAFTKWDPLARLALYLQQAGLSLRVVEALVLGGLLVTTATIAGAFLKGPLVGIVASFMVTLAAWRILEWRRGGRLLRFEEQLPDAITAAVQQLRAGRTLPVAIAFLAERFPPPLGEEFGKCNMELELAIPLEEVLSSLRERVPSRALRMVTLAISVTNKMGGNLADFLEAQAESLRLQIAYHRQVRALTAQARLSALVVGLLPGFVAGAFLMLQPSFFEPLLADPLGRILLVTAGGLQGVGIQVIRIMMRRVP